MKNEPLKLLGLTGFKGVGKDHFAKLLTKYDNQFQRTAFADHLKELCQEIFGVDYQISHELKECEFQNPIVIDNRVEELSKATGINVKPNQKVAHTPRELWQFVGTEYIRNADKTYWVEQVLKNVKANREQKYVVTDVRFQDEAEAIRAEGGTVLCIQRIGMPKANDTHASEAMDFEPDYVLGVRSNDHSLPSFIAQQSAEGLLDYWLTVCDYRDMDMNPKTLEYYFGTIPELA